MENSPSSGISLPPAQHGLDINRLEAAVSQFLSEGNAALTARTYRTGEHHYLTFCHLKGLAPVSASELQLMQFATYLAHKGLAWQSIKMYLAGTRHYLMLQDLATPFRDEHLPRLQLLLRGIKCITSRSTPDILHSLYALLNLTLSDPDSIMLWAAMNLCFFGFLWFREICCLLNSYYHHGTCAYGMSLLIASPAPTPSISQLKCTKPTTSRYHSQPNSGHILPSKGSVTRPGNMSHTSGSFVPICLRQLSDSHQIHGNSASTTCSS